MTTDACATPGCGHAKNEHWDGRLQCFDGLIGHCKSYLPPRPVPEERCTCGHKRYEHHTTAQSGTEVWVQCGGSMSCPCKGFTPATVPAPHAEAEAAWIEAIKSGDTYKWERVHDGFIAGYLRGRGDRG